MKKYLIFFILLFFIFTNECNAISYSSVTMTAATSGSSGITVSDNDDIDFGTGNFTLVWKGSLPDYTPSGTLTLMTKLLIGSDTAWLYRLDTNGTLLITLYNGAAGVNYISTVGTGCADGTVHELVAVITRETAGVAGSVIFYVDGVQLGLAKVITAGVPVTVSNARTMYISGNEAARIASTTHLVAAYNRALSSAEALDLFQNGINASDKWGNQTTPTPGCVFALERSGITLANWQDSSTNDLDASYPAAGKTLNIFPSGKYEFWFGY